MELRGMNPLWFASLLTVFLVLGLDAQAETETVSVEGGMEVEITYPGEIVAGREGMPFRYQGGRE